MMDAIIESGICAHRIEGDSRRCASCGESLRGRNLEEARRNRARVREAEETRRREEIAEMARPSSAKLARTLLLMTGLAAGLAALPPPMEKP